MRLHKREEEDEEEEGRREEEDAKETKKKEHEEKSIDRQALHLLLAPRFASRRSLTKDNHETNKYRDEQNADGNYRVKEVGKFGAYGRKEGT